MVGDADTGCTVAFHVGKLGIDCSLIKEASDDVTGVVEDDLDVEILGALRR